MMVEDNTQPGWEYKPGDTISPGSSDPIPDYSTTATPAPESETVTQATPGEFSWQAAEFAQHHRPMQWYLGLLALTGVIAAAVYFMTKSIFSTGTVGVLGIVVLVASFGKPKSIPCSVSSNGLQMGQQNYPFGQFRSFGVVREGSLPSLELLPIKKLQPAVSVHFEAADEDQIIEIIGKFLPYEDRKMAGVDRLAHRLRI